MIQPDLSALETSSTSESLISGGLKGTFIFFVIIYYLQILATRSTEDLKFIYIISFNKVKINTFINNIIYVKKYNETADFMRRVVDVFLDLRYKKAGYNRVIARFLMLIRGFARRFGNRRRLRLPSAAPKVFII